MGLKDLFSGGSKTPEEKVKRSVSKLGEEIESLIKTIEEQDEKLLRYEEKIRGQGMSSAGSNQAEQTVTDILIYFQNHVQKIEEHYQESKMMVENYDLSDRIAEEARHDLRLAHEILSYLDEEVKAVEKKVNQVEHEEGEEELEDLERIETQDERVLEQVDMMFNGKGDYSEEEGYGWIPLS